MSAITPTTPLVLASQSPRRSELLAEIGRPFRIVAPEADESHDASLTPQDLTQANARVKAEAGSRLCPDALVIGADTLVYIDGVPLGKPRDLAEAAQMLRKLSGRQHQVCTGVALAMGGQCATAFAVVTDVWFLPLHEETITAYHARVNPLDKAGAYGIQEASELILDRTEGSWTNVVGLPMDELKETLDKLFNDGH